jgi:hypothetical protein
VSHERIKVGRTSAGATSRSSRARRMLLALVTVALVGSTAVSLRLSDASFTSASRNPSTVFVAGTLAHTNDQDHVVVVTATGLEPGMSTSGTMILTGTGDVPGVYTLTPSDLVDKPEAPALSEALTLTVEDVTGPSAVLYEGPISDFDSAALGSIAPYDARTYRITVGYEDGPNDSALQGATTTLTLQVTGVSS